MMNFEKEQLLGIIKNGRELYDTKIREFGDDETYMNNLIVEEYNMWTIRCNLFLEYHFHNTKLLRKLNMLTDPDKYLYRQTPYSNLKKAIDLLNIFFEMPDYVKGKDIETSKTNNKQKGSGKMNNEPKNQSKSYSDIKIEGTGHTVIIGDKNKQSIKQSNKEQTVFDKIKETINNQDNLKLEEREEIKQAVEEMEESKDNKTDYLTKYTSFVTKASKLGVSIGGFVNMLHEHILK